MPAINSDIPIRDGYKFMGWYDNKDYNKGTQYYNDKNKSSRKYNKSKNITLYAGWRENLRIYFISLGRYDGFLIKGNGTTLFIDGGYEKQGDSCVAFVQSLGITKIDGLIGSHLHDNHIKAHLSFLKKMEVGRAYYGDELTTSVERKTCRRSRTNTDELVALLNEKNVPITYLEPGLDVKIGNLTFDILAPEVGTFVTTGDYPENRNSLNMVLKFGNHKFLFTGDYARDSEMLKNYPSQVENIDIFKWPHHGQEVVKNSLIDAMKPKYIIVPNENISDRNYAADGISRAKKYDRYIKSYYLGSKGYVLAESDGETLTVTKFSKR